ncbi:MAG: hypothetical protein QOE84_3509 [Actinomycetota bacterium]|nr:hypothetical protein [Actinomycetota bacterium]
MPVPSASAALVITACRALIAAVPQQLDTTVRRRPVTGDGGRTAAWGSPPVTLRCGVPLPDQTQTPLVIDGFPLVLDQRSNDVTYTTADRAVNAAVLVPKSYQDQAYLVQVLIPALKKLPQATAAPGP